MREPFPGKLRYFPVPTIRRELNARPAMTSSSDMRIALKEDFRTRRAAVYTSGPRVEGANLWRKFQTRRNLNRRAASNSQVVVLLEFLSRKCGGGLE